MYFNASHKNTFYGYTQYQHQDTVQLLRVGTGSAWCLQIRSVT